MLALLLPYPSDMADQRTLFHTGRRYPYCRIYLSMPLYTACMTRRRIVTVMRNALFSPSIKQAIRQYGKRWLCPVGEWKTRVMEGSLRSPATSRADVLESWMEEKWIDVQRQYFLSRNYNICPHERCNVNQCGDTIDLTENPTRQGIQSVVFPLIFQSSPLRIKDQRLLLSIH